jgi:ribosomal protein S18 acetylase RimI-like enzyme
MEIYRYVISAYGNAYPEVYGNQKEQLTNVSIYEVDPTSFASQRILQQVVQLYNHPRIFLHFKEPPRKERELANSLILSNGKSHLFVAEDEKERLVGTAMLEEQDTKIAAVEKFAVNPLFQGNNVGSQLMRHLLSEAFDKNTYQLLKLKMLMVPDWDKAYKLYQKFGFQDHGITKYKSIELGVLATIPGNLFEVYPEKPFVPFGIEWQVVKDQDNEIIFTEFHAVMENCPVREMSLNRDAYRLGV